MKNTLLPFLCCPACRSELTAAASETSGGEIKEGVLTCAKCAGTYKIAGFIPRFVDTDKYVKNFSFEWLFYKRTQLDSHKRSTISRDAFALKTGFSGEALKGRKVLDVGCGTGRFMEQAAQAGAEVVGVDLSFAVETAVENMRGRKNAHVVQADIFNLPFRDGAFDLIYSLGVLHHTPDTREAFLKLVPLLGPGGNISIWVYSNETGAEKIRNAFTDLYRFFTCRMPIKLLWRLCHLSVPLYYVKKLPLIGRLAEIVFPTSTDPDPEVRVLDTFDWYSPRYQFKHTYAEVEGWFRGSGLTARRLDFPVSVTGSKPK